MLVKEMVNYLNKKFSENGKTFCMAYFQDDNLQQWVIVCRRLEFYLYNKLFKTHLKILHKKYRGRIKFHVTYLGDGGIKALKMPNKPLKYFVGMKKILKELE